MTKKMAALKPTHFLWRMDGAVAVIQLNRPERKNPLTFESYAELRDAFRDLAHADDVHAVVLLPNGGRVHTCHPPSGRLEITYDARILGTSPPIRVNAADRIIRKNVSQ